MEPKKTGIRLNKPSDIKRLLTRIINELLQNDQLDKIQRARAIATLSNTFLRSHEIGELEQRLEAIEGMLDIDK